MQKLFGDGVSGEDLLNVITGNTQEMNSLIKLQSLFPDIEDKDMFEISATAINLAKINEWILISDDPGMPVPIYSEKFDNVKHLTSILAEECVKLVVPKCNNIDADDILEARQKLGDLLVPFRMSMQKLSIDLKSAIKDSVDYNEIKKEAKFIVESQIEPKLYEINQKIIVEKNKLWRKVFGKIINWVPFIVKAFCTPTPGQIFDLLKKASSEIKNIIENSDKNTLNTDLGLSYLLNLEKQFNKK